MSEIIPKTVSTVIDFVSKNDHSKSTRELSIDELEYAGLNAMSYELPVNRTEVKGWEYMPSFSTFDLATFRRGTDIRMIFKGTSNNTDLLTDIKLLINLPDRTFKTAVENYDKIRKTFPQSNITVSGHSLGGTKALFVSKQRNVKGVVFNPFTPDFSSFLFDLNRDSSLVTKFTNKGDILSNKSLLMNQDDVVVMVSNEENRTFFQSHSILTYLDNDNFI